MKRLSPPKESLISEEDLEDLVRSASVEASEDEDTEHTSAGLPTSVFVVPVNRRPFFPGMATPIVFEPGPYYEVLKLIAKSSFKYLGFFLTKKEMQEQVLISPKDIYSVGVLAKILRILPMESGGAQVIFSVERRICVKKFVKKKLLCAQVTYPPPPSKHLSKELKAYALSIVMTIRELLTLNPLFKDELQVFLGHSDFTEPGKLADFAVSLTTATREELQEVLETIDLPARIEKALALLKKEIDLSRLQNSIHQKIETTISKAQRDFFLKEQLKTIKKELGIDKDDKSSDVQKFELRLKKRTVPPDVMTVIQEELDKLQAIEPQSMEYSVCRNYLDWLTNVPWGTFISSPKEIDLAFAKAVLAREHYGLNDIKDRILEYVAVGKLSGQVRGNILCLVGPPGSGKTSVGKSIAKALKRPFFRFSVGGMRDDAEVKGHRRTYIGAMPGKIIQALKLTQAMDPVIMLDEVDKMGNSYQGDPASALLEVLDPEQNKEFLDLYLDVRCDLSNILFIVTANVLDTLPEPLKDRVEVLRLSGYVLEEKVKIAERYLIPRARKSMGLMAKDISFSKGAVESIIQQYAREAGVRNLDKHLKRILSKAALTVVSRMTKRGAQRKGSACIKVQQENLEGFLGKPKFLSERFYDITPVGVCMGLAWTAQGGATLYVEVVKTQHDKTEVKLTGQAGDVMKESLQIAWTYLQAYITQYAPHLAFFEKSQIHVHLPEGATPKDGPSAGITMTTAMLSLLLNKPVAEHLSMSGEITLNGVILPVGGLKEKVIAAKRSQIQTLIFPKENQRDYDELPHYIKKDLHVHFVHNYSEVFPLVFPQLPPLAEVL